MSAMNTLANGRQMIVEAGQDIRPPMTKQQLDDAVEALLDAAWMRRKSTNSSPKWPVRNDSVKRITLSAKPRRRWILRSKS